MQEYQYLSFQSHWMTEGGMVLFSLGELVIVAVLLTVADGLCVIQILSLDSAIIMMWFVLFVIMASTFDGLCLMFYSKLHQPIFIPQGVVGYMDQLATCIWYFNLIWLMFMFGIWSTGSSKAVWTYHLIDRIAVNCSCRWGDCRTHQQLCECLHFQVPLLVLWNSLT